VQIQHDYNKFFWNLIGNAIKFTPPNGFLTIKTFNIDSKYWQAEFTDTGIGIEAQFLPKLFSAFEQGGEAVTRRFGGLGLGLNISKALATMHGGSLSAKSEGKNKGATFIATMPCAVGGTEREPTIPDSPRVVDIKNVPPLRIILIEDNTSTSMILMRILVNRLGHTVKLACSFREAVELISSFPCDLILCDIGLPDGNGLDLVKYIKEKQPNAKPIALTGFGTDEDVIKSSEAGFESHLTKPIKVSQLEQVIAKVIAKR